MMGEKNFYHSLLFSVEAIVFGLLATLLLIYYRGLGRHYVKYWMLSLCSLSVHQLLLAIETQITDVSDVALEKIILKCFIQLSLYFHLTALLLGIYSAVSKKILSKKITCATFILSTCLAITATLLYGFNENEVYNRFYLRESLPAFLMGCSLLLAGFYLYNSPKKYFSAYIFIIYSLVMGLRYVLFSFLSIMLINEYWFRPLAEVLVYFDMGAFTLLAFSMLIWMQGAERSIAISAMNKAQYLGKHDSLTGALNRQQVMEKLPFIIEEAKSNQQNLAVFLLDIKRFKFVNDTYGLKVGDAILGEIANRLDGSIFLPKVIGRLSGDSFVFVTNNVDQQQQSAAIEHLHGLINRPYFIKQHKVLLQCSVGYCLYPQDAKLAEDLLQKANLALAQAESQNIATVKYKSGMQSHGRRLLAMEKEIRDGFEKNEFVLYFQPQLNLLNNRIEGFEALVRWQHPERGLLQPGSFLPDIESLNMLSDLDSYVLECACQSIARLQKSYHRRVTIAVNITAVEFQDPQLIENIQALLFKYQITPRCLDLEITENVVMTEIATAMNTIFILQNMGINVSIDDFGTGYSSLAYLRKLPIDKIKIDRSFIEEVASNDSDLTIVKSMVELSHGLGKRVLAEGVETEEQLRLLRNIGCDAVQGYYISKPIPENELKKYFTRI
ncbi:MULTISPECIES: putative bifunctional diguanylate cyclase/phosphodiesterase [unclassified Colwellia]|uniref:putative bifunctional diguanylate cyclase/phosphodiesterase n=1 Tax=unclassified Colwellia TaxID=196834 RepID=UPI0015F734C2|nr:MULTISPECIES: bifunctional diguanylate cyclase/phosphodiesterase [unclassified Colwellia]MBA6232338.1 bifunctional diguanylate cyclase/phosphodiesterase [Colwellia sp. MB02u-7]MBA6236014.1 bifunctional diguanylate cyclase/phosphodiesterase [Colwellia sp. MB02u-11]MBA6256732.1 bifunctional diguanylate cyclase/phosphodiesterase [Colwellia sp. MB3u-28]MBA6261447.1 bifunctional diguanylate cyclase/phosphodiesterase [Colwellia sp. MB3u-41]MBA6298581.1 bifunctional diguanylate cyclase/phosphodies